MQASCPSQNLEGSDQFSHHVQIVLRLSQVFHSLVKMSGSPAFDNCIQFRSLTDAATSTLTRACSPIGMCGFLHFNREPV
jgi:hypothetical protein